MQKTKRLNIRTSYILDIKRCYSHSGQVFTLQLMCQENFPQTFPEVLMKLEKLSQMHPGIRNFIKLMILTIKILSRYYFSSQTSMALWKPSFIRLYKKVFIQWFPGETESLPSSHSRKRAEVYLLILLLCFEKTHYLFIKYSLHSHCLLLPTITIAVVQCLG